MFANPLSAASGVTTAFGTIAAIAAAFFAYMAKVSKPSNPAKDDSSESAPNHPQAQANYKFGAVLATFVALVLIAASVYLGSRPTPTTDSSSGGGYGGPLNGGTPAPAPVPSWQPATGASIHGDSHDPADGRLKSVTCGFLGAVALDRDHRTALHTPPKSTEPDAAVPYYTADSDYGFWTYSRDQQRLQRYHIFRENPLWLAQQTLSVPNAEYDQMVSQAMANLANRKEEINGAANHAEAYGNAYVSILDQYATAYAKQHGEEFVQMSANCDMAGKQF